MEESTRIQWVKNVLGRLYCSGTQTGNNGSCLPWSVEVLEAQWVKGWPADLADLGMTSAEHKLFHNGVLLYISFHYHPLGRTEILLKMT